MRSECECPARSQLASRGTQGRSKAAQCGCHLCRNTCMQPSLRSRSNERAMQDDDDFELGTLVAVDLCAGQGFGSRYCSSSNFAIWLRCTSSGPSAKRMVRAPAYM